MKVIATLLLTLAAVIGIIVKRKYRAVVLGVYTGIIIMFGVYYNYKTIGNIVSFYHPVSQTFYQEEFLDKEEYPDALLVLMLDGKTVYTKKDMLYIPIAEYEGKDYHYSFYHMTNAVKFLEFCRANVISDKSLNDTMLTKYMIDTDFEKLGRANDLFRYTFIHTDGFEEMWNYFNYYWYYYEYLDEIDVYIMTNPDGENVIEANELVCLWDSPKDREEENLYIMTKAYYDANIAQNSMGE